MSHLVFDVILAAIIVIGAFVGIKRGAVKIVLSLIAFIAAAYLAYFLSAPVGGFINSKYIVPSISRDIYEAVDNGEEPSAVLPDYIISASHKLGVDLNSIRTDRQATQEEITSFVDTHFSPFMLSVVSTLLIIILFLIFSVIFNLLVKIVNKLVKHSFVGGLNTLLGAVFGALNGCVIAAVVCLIISLTVKYSVNLPFNITEETVNSSLFYSIFLYIF